ncbi:MAG: GAF domain-containing protein [Thermoflexales bacterium]|nr:GAF domain-containing protein [Thermoflexales bacterium]
MPDTREQSTITEFQAWQARTLNALLSVLTLAATVVVVSTVIEAIRYPERGAAVPLFGALYILLLLLTLLRRIPYRARLIGFLLVGYAVAVTAFLRGGLVGDGRLYLMILPLLALALSDLRMGLVTGGVSLLIHLAFMAFAYLGWLSEWVVVKENPMALSDWFAATAVFLMLLAGLLVIVGLSNRSLVQALRSARQSAQELASTYQLLEGQTRELERRARWLEAATYAAREAATLEEPDTLLSRVAEELARRMDLEEAIFYTAGPEGELVARAMAESRRIAPVDIAPSGVSPLAREAFQSGSVQSGWWGGLYEVAFPLRLQERTLGVMVVRFPTEIRIDGTEATVLGLIADQLAVALENARLFSETRANLRELEALYRQYTTQAWERFVRESPETVRLWTGPEEVPEGVWQGLFERARASGSVAVGEEDSRYLLAVPVKLRGVAIGVLGFHREQEAGRWRPEEIAAAETVAERLALAVENARLLEEAQRRAARERLAAEITARIRASLDPDTVLKTMVRELGRALRAHWAAVEVTGPSEGPSESSET